MTDGANGFWPATRRSGEATFRPSSKPSPTKWTGVLSATTPVVAAMPYLANVRTRDEVASSYFGGIATTVEFTKFQPLVVAADGTDVVAVIAEEFTKVTGKSLETTAVHHFTLDDDGRIIRFRPVVDTRAVIESATL